MLKFNWERDRGSLLLLFFSGVLIVGGFVLAETVSRIAGWLLFLVGVLVTMAVNVRRLMRSLRDR